MEGDGSQGLVFSLDVHALFGLHSLVQTIAPTATGHQAACELVDDDDFTVLHHIVLVAVVQVLRTQGRVQVVHQGDVGRVVQARAFWNHAQLGQYAFSFFMALLGQENLMRFFVQREITGGDDALARTGIGFTFLAGEQRHNLLHREVSGRVVFGLAADDQGRTGLVDQDRVHLVNDGVVQWALHTVMGFINHVVAQVIKAVFVVGSVGDVRVVSRLLFFTRHLGQVDAHRQAEEVEQLAHPTRVAAGQVVVHGDHMNAFARQSVEVGWQRGGQRFAFASAHLSDFAVVQGDTTRQLDVKVAHLHHALGTLSHHCEGFWQHRIQCFASGETIPKVLGFGTQLIVAE